MKKNDTRVPGSYTSTVKKICTRQKYVKKKKSVSHCYDFFLPRHYSTKPSISVSSMSEGSISTLQLYIHHCKTSSCNLCAFGIVFVWPALTDSTCLNWALDLETYSAFLLYERTIASECRDIYMKLKIQSKQEFHLQLIQLFSGYTTYSCIVCIVIESENHAARHKDSK